MIEPIKPKQTFQQSEIQDGDIICFQKSQEDEEYVFITHTPFFTLQMLIFIGYHQRLYTRTPDYITTIF